MIEELGSVATYPHEVRLEIGDLRGHRRDHIEPKIDSLPQVGGAYRADDWSPWEFTEECFTGESRYPGDIWYGIELADQSWSDAGGGSQLGAYSWCTPGEQGASPETVQPVPPQHVMDAFLRLVSVEDDVSS